MNLRKYFYPFCLVVPLCYFSCSKPNVKQIVTGGWTIDTLWYNDYEIRLCLIGNSIEFKEDKSAILPITKNYCTEAIATFETNGDWELNESKAGIYLDFKTKNEIFRGESRISFRKDEQRKLLIMVIDSKKLHMVSRKIMFNYDENISLYQQCSGHNE